jgi:hypothetical protein
VPTNERTIGNFPLGGMMTKEHRQLLGIKGMDKREKRKQLASYCMKLLEDDFAQDEIKCVCHIHL